MATYRHKSVVVEAERFDPDRHPWPRGVRADVNTASGFSVVDESEDGGGITDEILPGDYVITRFNGRELACPVQAQRFEWLYEACGEADADNCKNS